MIKTATVHIERTPEQVFDVLVDFSQTATWLKLCESLAAVGEGEVAAGTKLRYEHSQGGRVEVMDGEVKVCAPPGHLVMRFEDKMAVVVVNWKVAAASGGADVQHVLEIEPKNFLFKLMTPIMSFFVNRQIKKDVAALKAHVEKG